MTEQYLKQRITQYLHQLSSYYQTLEERKKKHPNLKDHITTVLNKVDLEASYLEDELAELETKQFSTQRIQHKMTVIMNNYSKVLDQIHKVMDFEPMIEIKEGNRGNMRGGKAGKMREFAQELNSEWMLTILNKGKQTKPKLNRTNASRIDDEEQGESKNRESIALEQLGLETRQLYQTMQRMRVNMSLHKHKDLSRDLQDLKQQEKGLLSAVEDLKDSNLLLRSEYQKLQKQLQHLRRNRQIMMEDH